VLSRVIASSSAGSGPRPARSRRAVTMSAAFCSSATLAATSSRRTAIRSSTSRSLAVRWAPATSCCADARRSPTARARYVRSRAMKLDRAFGSLAAACGGSALPDRVAVLGVDRLSGALAGQEVELPGTDLGAVRGPAAMIMLGSSTDTARVPDCTMRRRVSGALVARTVSCVSLLGHYAAMERARQFLLAAGAEALLPAPVLASAAAEPGLRYDARTDAFTLSEGPAGVLSLVAAQFEGAERDQACAVFRARLHAAGIPACP